ncbi:MAG: hypothetical protein QOE00_1972 [Ilumatobacteraceae bacterium]
MGDADASSVPGTDLFPDEPEFTPRPAWQVIEAARRQYLTGELTLHTTPTTRVFLRDGVVYFAERTTDGALAIRLMMEGVITREQMQRGTVIVNGVEHVGRMFDADPTIDRSSVQLCAELFTDDVLVDVANRTVRGYDLVLYRRHSSGIDRWYPNSVPLPGRPIESVVEPEPEPAVVAIEEPVAEAKPIDPPVEAAEPQPEAATREPMQPESNESTEPKNQLNAPPITLAVPVTRPAGSITTAPPSATTQRMPITPLITSQLPAVASGTPAPPSVSAPPLLARDVEASTIADEVAEAIKRAFAGLGG